MKRVLTVVCGICLVSIPGLAQKKAHEAKAPMTDQQFVDLAGQIDMLEANLGQLAQEVGGTQQVKDYGKMLADDHTNDYQQLESIAQQNNMTVPTAIDEKNNKEAVGPMHMLKGNAFDHKFIQAMIAGHTQALAIFKNEADDAQNPAIKSYAQGDLAALQKHLDDAKDLEKTGKSPAGQ